MFRAPQPLMRDKNKLPDFSGVEEIKEEEIVPTSRLPYMAFIDEEKKKQERRGPRDRTNPRDESGNE